jgi:hypothetical protein
MSVRISHPDHKANFCMVYVDELMIAFSYETPIAFALGREVVVRRNEWGATTERHMRHVELPAGSGRAARVPREEFERRLAAAIGPFSISEQP